MTSVYRDDDGYADIQYCRLIFNTGPTPTGLSGVYVIYDQVANKLYLRNDANTASLGGYAPGSANVIENSYCKLYCAETTKSGSGNSLTINWKIEFKQPLADKTPPGGTLKAWMCVADKIGAASGWVTKGGYTF